MRVLVTIAAITMFLGACSKQPPQVDETVVLNPVVVGDKNDLYEVVAPDRIKLAPGVTTRMVDGPRGVGKGMVLMRPNGNGGYVACSCIGATQGSCAPSSDNPENNPVCIGGCRDSEGNARACQMEGMIGPPKDPPNIRFRGQ